MLALLTTAHSLLISLYCSGKGRGSTQAGTNKKVLRVVEFHLHTRGDGCSTTFSPF